MNDMKIFSIGKIVNNGETVCIKLDRKYSTGLRGLDGYSHIQVLWWADKCDNTSDRSTLTEKKPYKKGPEEIGVFATHSPERPNPLAVSNVGIASVNVPEGVVELFYIDAFDGTEVIDIKPYEDPFEEYIKSSGPLCVAAMADPYLLRR